MNNGLLMNKLRNIFPLLIRMELFLIRCRTHCRNSRFLCHRYIMIYIILRSGTMKTGLLQLMACTQHYTERIIQIRLKYCGRTEEEKSTTLGIEDVGDKETVVPVLYPSYRMKELQCYVEGAAVSYDQKTGIVTAKMRGNAVICARDMQRETSAELKITISDKSNMTAVAGNYSGLYRYNGTWWYLKNGYIQKNYVGVVRNKNGWWYVENGKVDFTYNGFAQNSNGWWYLENGKVTFQKNDVAKGTVEGESGWWLVEKSKVSFTDTVARNKNGWWYIRGGKVDFDYTGVAKNKNGWWRIVDGKVDFNCNSVEKNANGWWYIRGGKVDFDFSGTILWENNKYIVKNGAVQD